MLEQLKIDVCAGNIALRDHGLVVWTGGNLSARDPATGLVAIKPSGRLYEDLRPEDIVIVDLDGRIVEGSLGPSSDTASHLTVYAGRSDVRSIVHTHSTYATAFAASGSPIPCVMTAVADEFGGDIPCGGYASIGGTEIGDEILRSIGSSPAVLMKQHGVFTLGRSITAAVKAAVMTEDVARTVAIALGVARHLGRPDLQRLPDSEIRANHERYTHRYGTADASAGVG